MAKAVPAVLPFRVAGEAEQQVAVQEHHFPAGAEDVRQVEGPGLHFQDEDAALRQDEVRGHHSRAEDVAEQRDAVPVRHFRDAAGDERPDAVLVHHCPDVDVAEQQVAEQVRHFPAVAEDERPDAVLVHHYPDVGEVEQQDAAQVRRFPAVDADARQVLVPVHHYPDVVADARRDEASEPQRRDGDERQGEVEPQAWDARRVGGAASLRDVQPDAAERQRAWAGPRAVDEAVRPDAGVPPAEALVVQRAWAERRDAVADAQQDEVGRRGGRYQYRDRSVSVAGELPEHCCERDGDGRGHGPSVLSGDREP